MITKKRIHDIVTTDLYQSLKNCMFFSKGSNQTTILEILFENLNFLRAIIGSMPLTSFKWLIMDKRTSFEFSETLKGMMRL